MGIDLLRKFCMNELIKQLALKSAFAYEPVKDQLWVSGPNEIMISPGLEKFAQLIIKECAEVCLNTAENQFSPLFSRESDGARVCYEKIKRHFGVEQ